MRQTLKDAEHLIRLAALFAVGVTAFIVIRAALIPDDFGELAGTRPSPAIHSVSPLFSKAHIFIQRGEFPHNSKEVMFTTIDNGPFQGTLGRAGPFPGRESSALPATRQFQVEREWCPVIVLRK